MSILRQHHEVARKLVHIAYGTSFAYLAFISNLTYVVILGALTLAFLLLLRTIGFTSLLYDVSRETYGELFYAIGIVFSALLASTTGEFMVAMLVLALADSAASLVGKAISSPLIKNNMFTASVAGSSAFFVVAVGTLFAYTQFAVLDILSLKTIMIATTLTVAEALSPYGFDNILIPVFTVAML